MIDRKLLRTKEGIDLIKKSEINRFNDLINVNMAQKYDAEIIQLEFIIRNISKNLNNVNDSIKNYYKTKLTDNEILENLINLKEKYQAEKAIELVKLESLQIKFMEHFIKIGNLLDPIVVISSNEDDNKVIDEFRAVDPVYELKDFQNLLVDSDVFTLLTHDIIMHKLDGIDMKRGAKIVGHRGYFLKNDVALLQNALARYAIDFLLKNNEEHSENERITYLQTPVFMKSDIMHATCQLSDFEENLYSLNEKNVPTHYLIATSEQPISGMFVNENIMENELPKKYLGDSLCFRREAGAHGKDNLGIFRIHQFQKIEMFYICQIHDAERLHKEMLMNATNFLKSLNISYKTVIIVSGAMNDAATLKYDIEAYFPAKQIYRELNSISNCTDYQSRSLNVRLGASKKDGKKEFVYMLNGTLCAVHRFLCCLLENYQTKDGVIIPEVLRPYMYGKDFLKYIR
ncbi:Serine--tRNA ligase [Cucumispora dikerogammari]|nr:Serine--tRNA ligase [Cucumispora dikerogammari]